MEQEDGEGKEDGDGGWLLFTCRLHECTEMDKVRQNRRYDERQTGLRTRHECGWVGWLPCRDPMDVPE